MPRAAKLLLFCAKAQRRFVSFCGADAVAAVLAWFSPLRYRPRIVEDDKLTPGDRREVITTLILGLTHGPQPERLQAAEVMSKIVAERLIAELESSGLVVVRKPIPAAGGDDNPGRRGGEHEEFRPPAS